MLFPLTVAAAWGWATARGQSSYARASAAIKSLPRRVPLVHGHRVGTGRLRQWARVPPFCRIGETTTVGVIGGFGWARFGGGLGGRHGGPYGYSWRFKLQLLARVVARATREWGGARRRRRSSADCGSPFSAAGALQAASRAPMLVAPRAVNSGGWGLKDGHGPQSHRLGGPTSGLRVPRGLLHQQVGRPSTTTCLRVGGG